MCNTPCCPASALSRSFPSDNTLTHFPAPREKKQRDPPAKLPLSLTRFSLFCLRGPRCDGWNSHLILGHKVTLKDGSQLGRLD